MANLASIQQRNIDLGLDREKSGDMFSCSVNSNNLRGKGPRKNLLHLDMDPDKGLDVSFKFVRIISAV